jgi:hypothetical protein
MPGLDPGIHEAERKVVASEGESNLRRHATSGPRWTNWSCELMASSHKRLRSSLMRWPTLSQEDFPLVFPTSPAQFSIITFMSTFEDMAKCLWRLGILRPLDQQRDWAFHFVFDCDADASDKVAEKNCRQGPPLFDLLVVFINVFGEYGSSWGFSSRPGTTFGTDNPITRTFETLASIGYLRALDGGYVWTDLIAPVMSASYEANHWPR